MRDYLNEKKEQIESWITELTGNCGEIQPLAEAVNYSLSGGKRLRPILVVMTAEMLGCDADKVKWLAVGLECIHNYSLVHDDLPCMDNDSLRHGKPCTHVKYGEDMAVITGDALLNLAFQTMLSAPNIDSDYVKAVKYIGDMAGLNGMVGGQCLDLKDKADNEVKLSEIIELNRLKTSCLFRAAIVGTAIMLKCKAETLKNLEKFADCLGIIFQIVDDILDITSSESVLGKNVGSDIEQGKVTYLKLVGMEQAKTDILRYESEALEAISEFGDKAKKVTELLRYLSSRTY